nr:hypothetical protein [Tanacetum cinerariifolium]
MKNFRMTLHQVHNWSSSAHPVLHRIVKDEIFPIVNQVGARVKIFEIQFLKEAAKFVRNFKSLAKEADESLAKHKALELEIEHLLRAVKLENKNVELEFQVLNYAKENAYLKTTYKNLFDSILVTRTQTKTIIDSLQNKLQDTIYENAKLRAQLFYTISDQKDTLRGTSANTKFAKQSILGKPPKVGKTHALSKPVTSNSIPTPQGSKVVKNAKVIAPGMFRINPFKPCREEKHVSNKVRASVRTNPITVSQPPVITKKVVNSDSNGLSSTGVDNTKTRRTQPKSKTKNDRVPSASKSSCSKNKEVDVEEHHRKLLLSRNKKHMSSECNNKQKANVSIQEYQKKQKPTDKKPKKVRFIERLASPKPSKPRSFLRWSPTGKMLDLNSKIIASSESENQSDCSKGDNACTSNPLEPTIKRFLNFTFPLAGTVRFGNDHIAVIMGFGDLQWGNILITRVYFIAGLGHNLFSVGQFCNSDSEVAFRRNACFVRNLEGVDLLSGNRTTNLYTINLHEMASTSPICLMARASFTKSWLWHQHLSHLNFDTINDLAKNDLVTGLPKFKFHKEHLCPSCEQGKRKKASHPPKPVPNSRQRLHLLHMDLCGPMRIASINGKWYVLVIIDDYSCYTWVHFLRSKDEASEMIKTFLKRFIILLQSPVIIIRTENGTEFKHHVLKEYFDCVGISHQVSSVRTPQQNGVVEQRNRTLVEAARTMLIFSRAPLFLWAEAIATALAQMAFKQRSLKPGLQSMTYGQISSGLDLTYAPSTITSQQPTEGELDLLFEAMYDDYIGGQSSTAPRIVLAAQAHQVRQTPTTSTSIADTASTPTNSSSQATIFLDTSQDVDGLTSQQHAQQQGYQASIQPKTVANNVLNAMFNANTFVNPFATPSTSAVESSSSQYEGIDFEESFTPVARMEAIRIFLAFAAHKSFTVFQMDVKTAFMHGTIDPTLFIRCFVDDILVVQVYVDDIIFGSTHPRFSDADYAGCKDTFKSTSGGAQFLDEKLLTDYGFHFNKIPIYCDSKSAIAISCNPVQHSRTKHIAVRYYFIKECVENGSDDGVTTSFQRSQDSRPHAQSTKIYSR